MIRGGFLLSENYLNIDMEFQPGISGNPEGAPTKYKPEYNKQAFKLALLGASDKAICWFLELEYIGELEFYRSFIIEGRKDRPGYLAAKEQKRVEKRLIRKKSQQKRRKESPQYRLRSNLSSLLAGRLKSKNRKSTFDLLDFTLEELKTHLEKQFRNGMTWENYGYYWHVDHKKPDCAFSYQSHIDSDFRECWALSNLQPLLKIENLCKGGRYVGS
jgi:hypothetical protein